MMATTLAVGPGAAEYPPVLRERLGTSAPATLWMRGDPGLLGLALRGLFCSVRLPPELVLPALLLARSLREEGVPVVSGFQSPVERGCLEILLRGHQPVVVCPARGLLGMRPPAALRSGLAAGRVLLVGALPGAVRRPTTTAAQGRNRLAAALAGEVLLIHASAGGRLLQLAREVSARRQPLACLDHPQNRDLLLLGARPVDPDPAGLPHSFAEV